ncbi:MAG: ankyrin repeat domain-containing protein [Candidatus Cardinium sp.]|nr:MAG: ankyrin repeat domain-containing protein [Candidatus Cardinium sp.]
METDKDGKTALHWAVANNSLEAVKAILQYAKSNLQSYKNLST